MLSKDKRLNLKKSFTWVASGKKLDSKYLKLFIKMGDNSNPKIGITVSGRVFKRAYQRNRVKRLISQAFHATYYQLPPAINILALPKATIIGVKSPDVLSDLEEILKHEKIIN